MAQPSNLASMHNFPSVSSIHSMVSLGYLPPGHGYIPKKQKPDKPYGPSYVTILNRTWRGPGGKYMQYAFIVFCIALFFYISSALYFAHRTVSRMIVRHSEPLGACLLIIAICLTSLTFKIIYKARMESNRWRSYIRFVPEGLFMVAPVNEEYSPKDMTKLQTGTYGPRAVKEIPKPQYMKHSRPASRAGGRARQMDTLTEGDESMLLAEDLGSQDYLDKGGMMGPMGGPQMFQTEPHPQAYRPEARRPGQPPGMTITLDKSGDARVMVMGRQRGSPVPRGSPVLLGPPEPRVYNPTVRSPVHFEDEKPAPVHLPEPRPGRMTPGSMGRSSPPYGMSRPMDRSSPPYGMSKSMDRSSPTRMIPGLDGRSTPGPDARSTPAHRMMPGSGTPAPRMVPGAQPSTPAPRMAPGSQPRSTPAPRMVPGSQPTTPAPRMVPGSQERSTPAPRMVPGSQQRSTPAPRMVPGSQERSTPAPRMVPGSQTRSTPTPRIVPGSQTRPAAGQLPKQGVTDSEL